MLPDDIAGDLKKKILDAKGEHLAEKVILSLLLYRAYVKLVSLLI